MTTNDMLLLNGRGQVTWSLHILGNSGYISKTVQDRNMVVVSNKMDD